MRRLLPLNALAAATVCGALIAPAVAQANTTVGFRCCNYAPPSVTIARGESVSWVADAGNDFDATTVGTTHHPLKFVGDSQPSQTAGTSATRTFNTPGTFRYYCTFHGSPDGTGMSGTITVTGGPAPAPGPATASKPAPSPGQAFGPEPVAADGGPPQAWVSLAKRSLRSGRLSFTLGSSKAGHATASLRYGSRTLGSARLAFTHAGERRVQLKLTRLGRVAIRGVGTARLRLVILVEDVDGNELQLQRAFTARA
jgi:plastocyanin